jgi:SAM-dependent methyltransferase
MAGGGLDLLDDESRASADVFAERYRALRIQEGWVDPTGQQPDGGRPELWRRSKSVSSAARILASEWPLPAGRVVADIGSGTGWAHSLFDGFGVIAIDILPTTPTGVALHVRADLRKLPLRDGTIDVAFYSASLHYAPVGDAVREAARVLRPGGLILVVDSPVYAGTRSQAKATARSSAYYAGAGYPELAAHYHPIDIGMLQSAFAESGFAVDRLSSRGPLQAVWRRLFRRPPGTLVVGRRMSS